MENRTPGMVTLNFIRIDTLTKGACPKLFISIHRTLIPFTLYLFHSVSGIPFFLCLSSSFTTRKQAVASDL